MFHRKRKGRVQMKQIIDNGLVKIMRNKSAVETAVFQHPVNQKVFKNSKNIRRVKEKLYLRIVR